MRDALLGLPPKDHDVASDATPDQVCALFSHTRQVGKHFGVVLVKPERKLPWIEVATFRSDGTYTDGRRPDSVQFTSAEEDAKRRDFTINGLFADPLNPAPDDQDTVIDHVGGTKDLKQGLLRAIGDPNRRFAEDHLRLLRAVRFAARLNFTIEATTWQAMRTHAPQLAGIARERIGDEVRRCLTGAHPHQAATLIERANLATHALMLPALPDANTWQPIRLQQLTPGSTYPTRLLAWLRDRATNALTHTGFEQLQDALRLTNDECDTLSQLQHLLTRSTDWPKYDIAARKRWLAHPQSAQARQLIAVEPGWQDLATHIEAHAKQLASDGIGIAPEPLLKGADLIATGKRPGPDFKALLDSFYDRQLTGELRSREDALSALQKLP